MRRAPSVEPPAGFRLAAARDLSPLMAHALAAAVADARRRKVGSAVPTVVGPRPPPAALPSSAKLAGAPVLVMDSWRLLGGMLCLDDAFCALDEWIASHPSQSPVVLIPVAPLLVGDSSLGAPTLVAGVVGRIEESTSAVVLLASDTDLARMATQETVVHRAAPPVCPPCARRVLPGEVTWIGRQDVRDQMADLVSRGAHVLVRGPAGTGKTTLAMSLAGHPELQDKPVLLLLAASIYSGTEYRGTLEAQVGRLVAYLEAVGGVLVLDEAAGALGRTGSGDQMSQDSLLDQLKHPLSQVSNWVLVATAVDREADRLRTDPALMRRFTEVVLSPPGPADLAEIVSSWSERLGISTGRGQEVVEAARRAFPRDQSPSREVKLLGQWAVADIDHGPMEVARRLWGPLVAPTVADISSAIQKTRTEVLGMDAAIEHLERALMHALRSTIQHESSGPLLVAVAMGKPGSGKVHLCRCLGRALVGDGAVREVQAGDLQTLKPTGAAGVLLVHGSIAHEQEAAPGLPTITSGTAPAGMTLGRAMSRLRTLDRWVVFLALDCSKEALDRVTPDLSPGPPTTLLLPVHTPSLGRDQRRIVALLLWESLAPRARQAGFLGDPTDLAPEAIRRACSRGTSPAEIEQLLVESLAGIDTDQNTESPESSADGQRCLGTVIDFNAILERNR